MGRRFFGKGKGSSRSSRSSSRRSFRSRRRERLFFRPLRCEELEDRRMLSGLTIITHGLLVDFIPGFNFYPDWASGMGNAIADRIVQRSPHEEPDLQVAQFRLEINDFTDIVGIPHVSDWDYFNDFDDPDNAPADAFDLKNSRDGEAIIHLDRCQAREFRCPRFQQLRVHIVTGYTRCGWWKCGRFHQLFLPPGKTSLTARRSSAR